MPEPVEPPAPVTGPYEVKGSVETRMDLTIDLAGMIRKYPDEYKQARLQGHEEWERPVVFLWEYIEGEGSVQSYGDWELVQEGFDTFDFDLDRRWSEEQFEALVAVCPEARLTPEVPGAAPAQEDEDDV